MVNTIVTCRECASEHLIRHGRTENGHPRYRCRNCGVTFSDSPERGHSEAFKEQVLAAYHERASMRGIARVFKISRNTLTKWIKEKGGS
jgi:transposase-like protein